LLMRGPAPMRVIVMVMFLCCKMAHRSVGARMALELTRIPPIRNPPVVAA